MHPINAFKAKKQADLKVKLAEVRLQQFSPKPVLQKPPAKKTQRDNFIEENAGELATKDLEFLKELERPASEVADYVEITSKEVRNRLNDGIYRPGKNDRPRPRSIDTLSVVETYILDGQTETK